MAKKPAIIDLVDQGIYIHRTFGEVQTKKYLERLIKCVHLQCEYMDLNDITVCMSKYLGELNKEFNL